MSPVTASVVRLALLAATSATVVVLQHRQTLGYGFYYDDYHFVRPFDWSEVGRAFHSSWDRDQIETPYYRPVTIVLYALRFSLLGINADGYHALSLLIFALCVTLFGLLVFLLSERFDVALLSAVVLAVHPSMPYSAVAWITNQMHLLEMLMVLLAFLWWFVVRRRRFVWWIPLAVLQIAVALVKEDGIMLIPAIVVVHELRRYIVEKDLPHVPLAFLIVATVSALAFLGYRQSILPMSTKIHPPPLSQGWDNFLRGLIGTFRLVPAKRAYQQVASWFVTALPVLVAVFWTRVAPSTRFITIAGIAFGVVFEMPFIYVVKAEQLHLVGMSAALTLTGGVMALRDLSRGSRLATLATLIVCSIGILAMSRVSRNITSDFEPSGRLVRYADKLVRGWAAVPVELQEYLARKTAYPEQTPSNPALAVDCVVFGVHGWERSPNGPVRWMSGRVTDLYLARTVRLVTIPLQHEIGGFRESAPVQITVDGRLAQSLTIADGNWHEVVLSLFPGRVSRLAQMHHVQIGVAHAWVPSQVIPDSRDNRTLALRMGVIGIR